MSRVTEKLCKLGEVQRRCHGASSRGTPNLVCKVKDPRSIVGDLVVARSGWWA